MSKVLGVAAVLGLAVAASANTITFTNDNLGSNSDGPTQGKVDITTINGGITVTVTNIANVSKHGQAISGVVFTAGTGLLPTSLTNLTGLSVNSADIGAGNSWTLADGTALNDNAVSNEVDHWKFSTSASVVTLATVGTGAPGGQPEYLIIPSTGTAGSGSSFAAAQFDPFLLGPATFTLTIPGVTAGTVLTDTSFTNFTIRFGTGPSTYSPGTTTTGNPPPPPVPLPAAAWSGMALLGGLGLTRKVRRHLEK